MMRKTLLLVFVVLAALALTACGGKETSAPGGAAEGGGPAQEEVVVTGDPERGKELFNSPAVAGQAGCTSCHSLEPDVTLVGPSLAGVATRAAQRVPGMSAAEYLKQSLLDPNAYVVEGFPRGVMPTYKGLSEQDLQDLIAFLLTLK